MNAPELPAVWFDGRHAQGQPVRLQWQPTGPSLLALPAEPGPDATPLARWPQAELQWPERTRHGQRVIHLRSGGSLHCSDAAAFDHWQRATGQGERWVVRAQQHWRATAAALLLLLLVLAGGYRWGLPLAAQGVLLAVPATADAQVGQAGLAQLQSRRLLRPSTLPAERQRALRQAFAAMVAAGHGAGQGQAAEPAYELHFHASPALGPNALALPGGHIVVTDELVRLLQGHDAALLGVMAHELGHVQARHGMRALVQFSLLTLASQLLLGDVSSLLAGVPALLGQLGYSRDFERAADAEALRLLRAAGHDPAVMLVLFERLQAHHGSEREAAPGTLGIALASHPADAERIAFFRGSPP